MANLLFFCLYEKKIQTFKAKKNPYTTTHRLCRDLSHLKAALQLNRK